LSNKVALVLLKAAAVRPRFNLLVSFTELIHLIYLRRTFSSRFVLFAISSALSRLARSPLNSTNRKAKSALLSTKHGKAN
jgi:hypothetical protein